MLEPTLLQGVSYTTVLLAKVFYARFMLLELLPFQEVNLQIHQINLLYSRFEIFTAMQVRNLLFSDMWPRHWVVWNELPYLDTSELFTHLRSAFSYNSEFLHPTVSS